MRIKFIFLAIFLLTACNSEKPVSPVSDCPALEFEDSPLGPEIIMADVTYHSPCFNPKNSNEIVYIRKDNTTGKAALHKRHIITKEDIFLTDAWVLNSPSWSVQDWITFDYNHNIFKLKGNGDSITQLTSFGRNYSPNWNPTGELLIFRQYEHVWPNLIISDKNGNELRTLDSLQGSPNCYWSPNGKLIAIKSYGGMGYIDPETYKFYTIKQSDNDADYGMSWFPNSRNIALASEKGLFIGDFDSKHITLLKESCYARRYYRPAVSPDGSKILVERDDIKKTGPSSGFQETNLYMMNADGSDERKIEF